MRRILYLFAVTAPFILNMAFALAADIPLVDLVEQALAPDQNIDASMVFATKIRKDLAAQKLMKLYSENIGAGVSSSPEEFKKFKAEEAAIIAQFKAERNQIAAYMAEIDRQATQTALASRGAASLTFAQSDDKTVDAIVTSEVARLTDEISKHYNAALALLNERSETEKFNTEVNSALLAYEKAVTLAHTAVFSRKDLNNPGIFTLIGSIGLGAYFIYARVHMPLLYSLPIDGAWIFGSAVLSSSVNNYFVERKFKNAIRPMWTRTQFFLSPDMNLGEHERIGQLIANLYAKRESEMTSFCAAPLEAESPVVEQAEAIESNARNKVGH